MTHDHNFFTPEHVDEQVDRLSQPPVRDHLLHNRGEAEPSQTGASLVKDLNAYYQIERQQNIASLQSAWQRISARQPGEHEHIQSMPTQPLPATKERRGRGPLGSDGGALEVAPPSLKERRGKGSLGLGGGALEVAPLSTPKVSQEMSRTMRNTVHHASSRKNFPRQLGLLAAILIAALLVGSLVVIVKLSHQQNATSAPTLPAKIAPTATSTPTPVPGKLLYTTPATQMGFNSLSWSPDSKRVASATADTGGVQFWDATTGAHRVTVQLPGGTSEMAYSLSWSPASQDVAIATNEHLLIVNGQTGKIIHSYAANVPTTMPTAMPTVAPLASNTASSGQTLHSRLSPNGGGYGYLDTAWSPDGHMIASAINWGGSGVIQVENPQTGATNFTLSVDNSFNISTLGWSSDGQYIAASAWYDQGSSPSPSTVPTGRIEVWKVSTRQIVFQHNNFRTGSSVPIAWQPASHNLAFIGAPDSNSVASLGIWDTITGKLVKQYPWPGEGTGALAWSPNGRYLAYESYGGKSTVNVVILIDTTTGKQIYLYKGHHKLISTIAWSPNGQYIASAEGNTEGPMVAQVWTA